MDSAKDVAVRESLRKIGNTEHGLQSVLTQDIRKQLTTITQHIDQLHARLISTLNTGDDSHAPGQGLDNMAARFKKVFELLAEYRDIYGKLDQRITDAEQSFRVLRFQFQRDIKSEWINVPVQQSHDTAMAIMPWDVAKRGKRRNAAMGAKKKKPRKKRAAKVLEGKKGTQICGHKFSV